MIDRRVWLQATVLAPLGALIACGPSEKERVLASRLVANMTTHAVGRHLIDLPADFEMGDGRVELTYGLTAEFTTVEVSIESFVATAESFEALVRKRASGIASRMHLKLANTSMLIETVRVSPTAAILRRYRDSLTTKSFRSELVALVGGVLLICWQDSYSEAPAPAIQRLTLLSRQLASIESEAAGGKGFRFGKLVIAGDHDQENGDVFFRSKSAPGVVIEFHADAISPDPSPSLLGRWHEPGWNAALLGPKPSVVREGPITLAGMRGEELLTKASYLDGRVDMKIWAESKRPTPGFATPLLKIEIDTVPRGPKEEAPPAVWSELDTITIWDVVVKSVRLRPGAV